jgi:hypothetical protein
MEITVIFNNLASIEHIDRKNLFMHELIFVRRLGR